MSANTRVEWARRLAQTIVTDGYAADSAVTPVLDEACSGGTSFPALLISRNVTSQEVVLGLLSQMSRMPVVDLVNDRPSDVALAQTPVAVARQFGAVGYRLDGDQLTMAFGDPPDEDDVRSLSVLVGRGVVPVLANPLAIEHVLAEAETAMAPPPPPAPPPAPPAGHSGNGSANGAVSLHHTTESPSSQGHSAGADYRATMGDEGDEDMPLHLDDLLRFAVSVGASDLHLTTGLPACVRLNGAVRPIEGCPVLDNETIRDMVFGILPQTLRERFEAEKELDTSHSIVDVGRFRLNVFQQRGTVAAALRAIPHEIPAFEVLGIPEAVALLHRDAPRARARDRPDRIGQVDDPGVAGGHHQQDQAAAHHHGRGPHRVPPQPQARDREPARGRPGHHVVLRGAAQGAARGPRRHPRR